MKHLSSVLLAAVLVAASVTACFKDAQDPLRNGATRIELSRNSITLSTGDSLSVQAEIKDGQGNVLNAAGVQWATDNAAIATVRVDDIPIPGPAFSRAFVLARADTNGGVAHVIVTAAGLTDTVRVLVLPTGLTATASATGTARADTIGTTAINAGDTVMITSTNVIRFDAALTQITLGTKRAYVFSRTPTVVKAVALAPFQGRPWVTGLWYGGPTEVGQVSLADSMQAGSITVSRPRYYPTITVTADTMFVPAPTGTTFDTIASVRFGTSASAITFARTTAQLKVINTGAASYAGLVTVRYVKLGSATLDSLMTVVPYTLPKYTALYNGAVTQTGDTMVLAPQANTTFDTVTSTVTIGTRAAYVLSRSATQLKVIAPLAAPAATDTLKVSNVHVGLATVNLTSTAVTYTIGKAAFTGTVTQTGDTVVVTPPTNTTFDAATANVAFGTSTANGIVLSRTTTSLKVMSPVTYTGSITISGIKMGLATVGLATTASYTINAAAFIGTATTLGKYLDTVNVKAGTGFKFTTTPTASVSNVMIGGVAAWVLLRTADSMLVISRMPSTGQIGVTNATVGGSVIPPELKIAGNVVITANPTGEANEPANNAAGAVVIDLSTATAANPLVIFGAVDGDGNGLGTDAEDYFVFTTTTVKTITLQVQFAGTGAGGATNPDLDFGVCNASCSSWVSTAGMTGAQPENITLTNRAAGTYNIYVNGWDTATLTRAYKLIVYTN